MAEATIDRPQLSQASAIDVTATTAIDCRGVRPIRAIAASARFTGGDTATTKPVSTTRHICIPNERSSQRPSPQYCTTWSGEDDVAASVSTNTTTVSRMAMTNESGTQR